MDKALHDAIAIVGAIRASYSDEYISTIKTYSNEHYNSAVANKVRLDNALAYLLGVCDYPEKK